MCRVIEETLRVLQRHGTVHAAAAVDLEGVLVGEDVNLDAAEVAAQRRDRTPLAPIVVASGVAIDEEASIVASASGAAIAKEIGRGEVGANLLGSAAEVVDAVWLVGEDVARGNEIAIASDTLATIRQ